MAVATGLGGSFQYGLNLSLINVPTKVVQGFINSTWESRYGHPVSSSVLTLIWSIIASVFAVGGLAGAILAGPMAQQLGRKCGLLANNAFAILASVLMGVSDVSSSFELLIIGRFLIGVNCGVGLSLQPMYLSECAPQHQRGALAMSTSIFLTLGIFCGQIVGLREVLGGQQQLWAVVLALPVLPALTQLLVLPFFPESPCYLLIDRGQPQQARQVLAWLRGGDGSNGGGSCSDVAAGGGDGNSADIGQGTGGSPLEHRLDEELLAMRAEQEQMSEGPRSVWDVMRNRGTRWQLITVLLLNVTQQLSGLNAIYFYSTYVFKEAKIPEEKIPYVTLGTGAAEIITAMSCGMLVDGLGRRPLLLCGYVLMSLCCAAITVSLALQERSIWMPYLSVALTFAYILSFGIGPGGIMGILPAELFMQDSRSAAFVISGSVNWFSFFLIGLLFPFLVEGMGPYCFVFFMVDCVMGSIIVCILLPETKDRSFVEISRLFHSRNYGHAQPLSSSFATCQNEAAPLTQSDQLEE
ncbi:solute carrier family 2, facilitated glucose transporter member 5-like isoform X2 [Petromyzon marinus]|nr:solute carrier family 2, facilitated glucose transporter member 5-like isoform X2 [Petromyzon marinus]